jgi:hypothetical protein
MQWGFIVVLIIAISIILFPAAFVWYMNIGGMYVAIKEALKRRATLQGKMKAVAPGKHETASIKQ